MPKRSIVFLSCSFSILALSAGAAGADPITFDEVPLSTWAPTIGGFEFHAGGAR